MNKTPEEIKKKIKQTSANLGRIGVAGKLPPRVDSKNALSYIVAVLNQNASDSHFNAALKYGHHLMATLYNDVDDLVPRIGTHEILRVIEIVEKLVIVHDLKKLSKKYPEMEESFSKIINICAQICKEIQKPNSNISDHQNLMKEYRGAYINAVNDASQLSLNLIDNGFKDIFRKIEKLRLENIYD